MKKFPCKVCETMAAMQPGLGFVLGQQWAKVECPRCGTFNSHSSIALNLNSRQQANASGWLRENTIDLLTQDMANDFAKLKTPTIEKRVFLLLKWILEKTNSSLGGTVIFPFWDIISEDETNELLGCCYCLDKDELKFLIDFLIGKQLIEDARKKYPHLTRNAFCLTVEGFKYIEMLNKNFASNTGFCAMSFSDRLDVLWSQGVNPAIEAAGYLPRLLKGDDHLNDITDKIIAEIRCARFMIADLTDHRPNVYYEAGFARGLDIPVILICRKDHIGHAHFDVNHLNILEWEEDDLSLFKGKLEKRIESNFGRGKNKIKEVGLKKEVLV